MSFQYLMPGWFRGSSGASEPAPEPPDAPSNLSATSVNQSRIDLSWTDNSDNETGFKIERSPNGSDWTEIHTTAAGVTSYQNTGLTENTLYYYRVRATNGDGDSAYTATANATTKDFGWALVNVHGFQEAWRLTDITSGTTITAVSNSARNGTLTGWTLQDTASPAANDSLLAPLSDGTNDYGDILTANLTSLFNSNATGKGTMMIVLKVANAGVWTDTLVRLAFQMQADANNRFSIRKHSVNNTARFIYAAGGTVETIDHTISSTNWLCCVLTWDKAADEVKAYIGGAQVGATQTGLGVWAGALSTALIGALTNTPTSVWSGALAYAAVRFDAAMSGAQISTLNTDLTT